MGRPGGHINPPRVFQGAKHTGGRTRERHRKTSAATDTGTATLIGHSDDTPRMPTVYITAPPGEAPDIAQTLVAERLAACVNRFDCDSVYRWDGEVHADEVPCIERFDESAELDAFATWREETVR